MALIIENGTGVANANSYGDLADCRDYATARGVTLGSDADVTVKLILATDYLEALEYVGRKVLNSQALSWPRQCVQFDFDTPFPTNQIPANLILAQYQLVIEQANGIIIQPSTDYAGQGGFIIEDKTGPLDTKYSERIGVTSEPLTPKVTSLLRGLVRHVPPLTNYRI